MALVPLSDRDAIERWLRRDAPVHLYELGDLDDFFWPSTTWYGLGDGPDAASVGAIALLYQAPSLPVVVALGRAADLDDIRALLEELAPLLPSRFYAHLVPGSADVLGRSFALEPHGTHARMVLASRALVDTIDTADAVVLGPHDEAELLALYARAYPGNWFDPRMLETGAYFGVRRGGTLASVAGVHVVSRSHRIAALGNIATDPSLRGRGLARIALAAVC
jgi:hypothetical protein